MREEILAGKKYRVLADEESNFWKRISYWNLASDTECSDGETVQAKINKYDVTISDLDTKVSTLETDLNGLQVKEIDGILNYKFESEGADAWRPFKDPAVSIYSTGCSANHDTTDEYGNNIPNTSSGRTVAPYNGYAIVWRGARGGNVTPYAYFYINNVEPTEESSFSVPINFPTGKGSTKLAVYKISEGDVLTYRVGSGHRSSSWVNVWLLGTKRKVSRIEGVGYETNQIYSASATLKATYKGVTLGSGGISKKGTPKSDPDRWTRYNNWTGFMDKTEIDDEYSTSYTGLGGDAGGYETIRTLIFNVELK